MERSSNKTYSYRSKNRMYSREREERHNGWHVDYRPHSRSTYDFQMRSVGECGLDRHSDHYNHYHPYQRPSMLPHQHVDSSHRDSHRMSSQRSRFEYAPYAKPYSRDRASTTRDRRQRSVRRRSVEEKRHTARHHSHNRGRALATERHEPNDRRQSPFEKVQLPVEVTAAQPPVTFPELWGTYVTEADEAQMDLWRRETEELLASTPCSIRGQAVLDGCKSGSRKRLCEDACSEFLPPAKVYINKEHARFRHLF